MKRRSFFQRAFLQNVAWMALLVVTSGSSGVTSCFAQSIGIFGDSLATTCEADIPPGLNSGTFYIMAMLGGGLIGGPGGDGIVAAEFKVSGFPAGPIVDITPNPNSNVNLGNPLFPDINGDHFAIQAYPTCEAGSNNLVILYACTVSSFDPIPPAVLQVETASPTSNPMFTTPILAACDEPAFTAYVATGGRFWINPAPNTQTCVLAVEASSWGGVKALFR